MRFRFKLFIDNTPADTVGKGHQCHLHVPRAFTGVLFVIDSFSEPGHAVGSSLWGVNTYTTSRLRVNYLCLFLIIAVDKLERFTCMFS